MDENKKPLDENEESLADAIIGSIIDIEPVSDEQIADAIVAGASTLVGLDEIEDDETATQDSEAGAESGASKKPKKKKVNGTFFLGLISALFGFLCVICCCTPFSFPLFLPVQLLFLTLAIAFLILDKKYNGKSGFSISAMVSTIFSVCIVLATLFRVGCSLIFGLAIKPLLQPYIQDALTNIASVLNINF